MDFQLFESMTPEEAYALLEGFLESERPGVEEIEQLARGEGVYFDYRLATLFGNLKWIYGLVQFTRVPIPDSEPWWIRDFHKDGVIEFHEESRKFVLRAAFYLGQTFVVSNPKLKWTIGNREYIQQNMPVVAGFQKGMEMAAIMVVENVFTRIAGNHGPMSDIDKMIETWSGYLP
jgi:hypothetical protein